MNFTTKVRSCLLAAVVLAAMAPAVSDASPTTPAAPENAPAHMRTSQVRTVTLITGDRVRLDSSGAMSVQRGKGRSQMSFVSQRRGKHRITIPADALPLVRSGRLDARLFDVTALLDFGYDDRRKDLPLILSYPDESRARSAKPLAGARSVRTMPAVKARSVRMSKADGSTFWLGLTGGVTRPRTLAGQTSKVWLDGLRKPALDESVPQIGAPTAWQAGLTGTGVKVAVLDTGIDATHPDLADRVVAQRNFTEDPDSRDLIGHGTHVASTVAGSGAASNGQYKGVAPGAKLLDGKVCAADCPESSILAGMEWAAAEQDAPVVNLSLGGPDTSEVDPVEQAVNSLTATYGTLFVIAAGNYGPLASTVTSPGSADAALTVGAVDKSDQLAAGSSRGPRGGDNAIKPDITAPGLDITAARSKDGVIGEPGAPYTALSGTSMATPHVAGSAAILAGQHPTWTPTQLKSALMASAKPSPTATVFEQGAGRVDLTRAITQTVSTTPASVSFGLQQWPHGDDQPTTKTVGYDNHGTAPATLTLALHTTWADGKPTPAGMFTLDKNTLTIPAGATGTATITVNTAVPGPDGIASGYLTATAGAVQVRTPVGVVKEGPTYDFKLTHTNRAGQLTGDYYTEVLLLDENGDPVSNNTGWLPYDPDGTVTLRLPKGRYLLTSTIDDPMSDPDKFDVTQLTAPIIDLNHDRALAVDARKAKPISISGPRAGAEQLSLTVAFTTNPAGPVGSVVEFSATVHGSHLYSGQLGGSQSFKGLSTVTSYWSDANANGDPSDSPVAYNLFWYQHNRVLTGFRRHVVDRDLATVRADYSRHAAGGLGYATSGPNGPGLVGAGVGFYEGIKVPTKRTEYYNAEGGITWDSNFQEYVLDADGWPVTLTDFYQPRFTPRAGQVQKRLWNQAVFGPAFSSPPGVPPLLVSRSANTITVDSVPIFSDNKERYVNSATDGGRTTLYRNGKKFAESPYVGFGEFAVPATAATYRLEIQARRSAPFSLSTRINVAWTFRSTHVAGTTPVALPVSVVRFTPKLSENNTAPAGGPFTVPVTVRRQSDDTSQAGIRKLTVQVSYDDGQHWQPAAVNPTGDGIWDVKLQHPNTQGFVSLRATATDATGNTVKQTIIHAYQLRKKS